VSPEYKLGMEAGAEAVRNGTVTDLAVRHQECPFSDAKAVARWVAGYGYGMSCGRLREPERVRQ
jgi:hypothetical protein